MTPPEDYEPGAPPESSTPQLYRYRFKYLHKYGDLGPDAEHGDARDSDSNASQHASPSHSDDKKQRDKDGDKKDGEDNDNKNDKKDQGKDDKKEQGDKDKDDKDKTPEEKRKDKRKKIIVMSIIAVVFVLAALIWLLLYIFIFSQRETTDDAYVQGDMVTISSRVAGTVVEITAEETDRVHAGEVLVRLDPADAQVSLMNARGQLAQAVRQAQQQIQQAAEADAVVTQRRAQYQNERDEYARRHPLLELHAVAKEEVDNAYRETEAAYAALQQAERQAAAAHAQVDGVDIRDVPAVVQARAAYRNAYINNNRDAIVSPIDGYAARRQVQVGQRVQPGQDLLTVVPMHNMWINANFKETQLQNIRIGQPVEVTTDIYSDVTYHGKVQGLTAGTGSAFSLLPAENATGNWIKVVQRLPVRIALDDNELEKHPLRLGLSAYVNVNTHNRNGIVLSNKIRQKPLATTAVYEREVIDADQHADDIINDNMVTAPNSESRTFKSALDH